MTPPPLPKPVASILVTTADQVEGRRVEHHLGVVRGVVVRATGFSIGLAGGLKAIAGGNIPEFSRVCDEARQSAYEVMVEEAARKGADAVIAFRYDTSGFLEGCTEVMAYGTAVTLQPGAAAG